MWLFEEYATGILGVIAIAACLALAVALYRITSVSGTARMPEYTSFRKMQVYEEALNEAQLEEGISEKERALLVRLRDSLGISESDAEAIEGELQSRLPSFG